MGVQEESHQAYKAHDTETYEDYMQDKDKYEDCMDCQDFCEPNISQMVEAQDFQGSELQDDAIYGTDHLTAPDGYEARGGDAATSSMILQTIHRVFHVLGRLLNFAQLILQWTVGLWILVHCFLKFTLFKGVISSKLGSSFLPVAYISVVAVCTLLSMAVTYPLTQLFFFHILLIRKGISTYDYIVAMREQDQKGLADTVQSSSSSPTSSVGTIQSAGISTGALPGRTWCTPPRLFLDHEQGIYPSERSLSVKDATSGLPSKIENDSKKSVKLNPWTLAALNKEDVLRAATAAKKQSSILRPVTAKNDKSRLHDSSGSMSSPGDLSTANVFPPTMGSSSRIGAGTHRNIGGQFPPARFENPSTFSASNFDGDGSDSGDIIELARRARKMLNPLQMEAMNAFKSSHTFSGTTFSSPDSSRTPSESRVSPPNQADVFCSHHRSPVQISWRYNPQGSESTEDSDGDGSSPCTPIRQVFYVGQQSGP
ncbi:hypothetical protein L7F22_068512 [Adiantum nelumboides]|nr:hypothetical protein [Adiantum nelumboides]